MEPSSETETATEQQSPKRLGMLFWGDAFYSLFGDLDFFELSAADLVGALKQAKRKGVRGGHVHDLFHAAAADKCKTP